MAFMDVIAHRGLAGTYGGGNTVRSILAAVDAGADGVAVDLRVSSDGIVVLAGKPHIADVAGTRVAVSTTSWRVLRGVAAGSGRPLIRLTDALPALDACRQVILQVQAPAVAAGSARAESDRVAAVIAGELAVLVPSLLHTRVTVASADTALLAQLRDLIGRVIPARYALLGRSLPVADLLVAARLGNLDEIHPAVSDLRQAHAGALAEARVAGVAIAAWSVNGHAELLLCARTGVSAVVTDDPIGARQALRWLAAPIPG